MALKASFGSSCRFTHVTLTRLKLAQPISPRVCITVEASLSFLLDHGVPSTFQPGAELLNATPLGSEQTVMAGSAASGLLSRQLKLMQSDKDIPGISCGLIGSNVFEWEVMLMISDDCKYYGGTSPNFLFCHQKSRADGRERLMERCRRILPRSSHLSARVSTSATQDDVSDADISP